MNSSLALILLMGAALSMGAVAPVRRLSDAFIAEINAQQSSWRAGRNFHPSTPMKEIRGLMGVLPAEQNPMKLPIQSYPDFNVAALPDHFDAREEWPECADVIGNIRDQAGCSSDWAVASAGAMSDRICIHSKGTKKLSLSATDLMSCQTTGSGCQGGWLPPAWHYWNSSGIVTGGEFNSAEDSCRKYPFESCEHFIEGARPACPKSETTPQCSQTCDADSKLTFAKDKTFGSAYMVPRSEVQIQVEIFLNGPVATSFVAFEDFAAYKSGVYRHVTGKVIENVDHAIRIIGWGVENNTPYWLCANSWNEDWGDKGYFKMLRGYNHCGVEGDVNAGIPKFNS